MIRARRFIPLLALSLLALPSTVRAQRAERLLLQSYGAYVFTSGSYADLVNNGLAVGGLLGLTIGRQVWLMGSFSYTWHDGEGDLFDWRNYGYFGMLGYDVVPPGMNGNMIFFVGAGSLTFDPRSEPLESEAYFALNGGMKIVYDVGRRVAWTLDLALAVALSEGELVGGDAWFLPIGLGLAIRF